MNPPQGQLWNAGPVKTYAGSYRQQQRDRDKVLDGRNRERMQRRTAARHGLTLSEYQAQQRNRHTQDLRTLAAKAAAINYKHHASLRAAVDAPHHEERRNHNNYKRYYAENKHLYYLARYKRRALEKGTQHEHINRIKVFERDNWTCRYCGTKTSDTVKRGHPRKAILAHINALAAGGTHTLDNVCCLCHKCNTADAVNNLPLQKVIF